MRRTSLIAILVFVAGLGIGYFARGAAGMLQRTTHAADFAAIEKAHQEDIEATLTQDPKKLIDLWAEDAVNFNPGSPPAVGKQAIEAEHEKFRAQYPGLKVLSYTSKYKNLQVEDGLACEWFEKEAQYKLSLEAPPTSWHAKGLLVLKRQSDGSWRGGDGLARVKEPQAIPGKLLCLLAVWTNSDLVARGTKDQADSTGDSSPR